MKLEYPVPAVYLDMLRPGLDVAASTPAFEAHRFSGKVKAVDSRVDPVTRAVRVRALLPNPEHLLRPGMLMHVELDRDPRTALVIPEEALIPLGRQQFVYVLTPQDTVEKREIHIGTRRPGRVEVREGLVADERVVTHGHLKIRPGQAVRILAVDDGSRTLPELLRSLPGGERE
jgi:membrane fusion protein (multidrug efflux system)